MRRLKVAIAGEYSPVFRQAMEDNDVKLYLGDEMLLNLPEGKRRTVDRILCALPESRLAQERHCLGCPDLSHSALKTIVAHSSQGHSLLSPDGTEGLEA